jgi:hypothetical protein
MKKMLIQGTENPGFTVTYLEVGLENYVLQPSSDIMSS